VSSADPRSSRATSRFSAQPARPGDPVGAPPIKRFKAKKMVKREQVVKREIDAYHVSDVDNTAVIYVGDRATTVFQSLDLPDAVCDGLTFKQRVIQTARGDCLLLARWKPERHMRRSTTEWSQKWFVEKRLFPPDRERFWTRLHRQAQEPAPAAATPPTPAAETPEPEATAEEPEEAE